MKSVTSKVCFRFDIDTPCCLQKGVPALLQLADELGVCFTFFFNPGRAVVRRAVISKSQSAKTAPKLSPRRKLGFGEWLRVALVNPALYRLSGAQLLARAEGAGHEIGLHGGRNHAQWQRNAHTWSSATIRSEIEWGLNALAGVGINAPKSFASPGWNSSAHLSNLLPEFGFSVLADRHGALAHGMKMRSRENNLALVATDILGEPGGVGYLETSISSGQSESQTVDSFISKLKNKSSLEHVVYDHPCFAGQEALPLLRKLIVACRREGVSFTTIREIGERVLSGQVHGHL